MGCGCDKLDEGSLLINLVGEFESADLKATVGKPIIIAGDFKN